LRATGVLGRLSGPLCEAVLGCSDGVEQLRRLEASGMFVVPLDRKREWYRYHALFREFLLSELRRRASSAEIEKLHLKAADWFELNGSPTQAVEHGVVQPASRLGMVLDRIAGSPRPSPSAREFLIGTDNALLRGIRHPRSERRSALALPHRSQHLSHVIRPE
jgi:hypothetical protein